MGEVPLTILYLYAMCLFAHQLCHGFLPMEKVRQPRDEPASTGNAMLVGSCQAVAAIVGFVVSNKGMTTFWNSLSSVERSVKLLTSVRTKQPA